MNTNFTPKALKIVPVEYLDGVIQPSICDEHDAQICLIELGKENYAPILAAAPEMYEILCDVLTDCKLSDGMRLEIERIMKKARREK